MNNPINAISDEINSVTTEEERNHSRDKPDVHEGETPAEEKWRQYKTQTEKAEIKERRDRQRALEKVNRETARKAERQAQREDIRREMTTDSQAMSSNTAIDGAGVSATTLGTALIGGVAGAVNAATTATTAIAAGLLAVPVGLGAGLIMTSGTSHANNEHAEEIAPNSQSPENQKEEIKIQRIDHVYNVRIVNNEQRILLNPDQHMDPIPVAHIPNLKRFLPTIYLSKPPGFYRYGLEMEMVKYIQTAYGNLDIYIHSFQNRTYNDIPLQYTYLRENLDYFNQSVNSAKFYAREAAGKLTNAFLNSTQDEFIVNPQNPLIQYIAKVFVTVDQGILSNIAIRLHEAIDSINKYFDENHGIFFATAKTHPDYPVPEESLQPIPENFIMPLAFAPINDALKRIIIMVDKFEQTDDIFKSPQTTLPLAVLHEASHQAIGSSDFILSPTRVTAGDALDFMELMTEALGPSLSGKRRTEYLELDNRFFEAYKRYTGINTITPEQFLRKLQLDPMLKANVMVDNADFLARMIYDIACDETFPETELSTLFHLRPRRGVVETQNHKNLFEKIIPKLVFVTILQFDNLVYA